MPSCVSPRRSYIRQRPAAVPIAEDATKTESQRRQAGGHQGLGEARRNAHGMEQW